MAIDKSQKGRVGRGTGKSGGTASMPRPVPVPVKAPMGGYRRGSSVAGPDIEVGREHLLIAYLALAPEELSQRQAFKSLLPDIYMLRNKGYSFKQIVKLLSECCGFTIQPSTARGYFNEMLVGREDECLRRLNDSIMVLAEHEKMTKGDSMLSIASKVAAAREAERRRSGAMAVERAQGARAGSGEAGRSAVETGVVVAAKPREAAAPPGPKKTETGAKAPVAEGDFAVSGDSDGQAVAVREGVDDASQTAQASVLRCGPLQPGVKPCKPYKGVPEDIYKEGDLEHPAISGLILSLPERLFGAHLEIIDEHGEKRLETMRERMFRIQWKKPIPPTKSSTDDNFVKMDASLMK